MLPRQTYHFFNRANGWENMFLRAKDYHCFIEKIRKHVSAPVQFQVFSMIPKHFHLCGKVRDENLLQLVLNVPAQQLKSNKSVSALIERSISRKFSNGFNSYAQWFNKSTTRKGSLFVPNFKKEVIEGTEDLKNLIHFQSQYDNPKFQRGKELCNRAKKLCNGVEFIQSSQTSEKTPSRK